MSRGTRLAAGELAESLQRLTSTKAFVRIENVGVKMFINRNASGIFVVQFGGDFKYPGSVKQVLSLIKSMFGRKCAACLLNRKFHEHYNQIS